MVRLFRSALLALSLLSLSFSPALEAGRIFAADQASMLKGAAPQVASGGGDPGVIDYATLLSGATWYAWDPYQSAMFQNSGGAGAVSSGDPVGYIADLSSGGFNATQATAGNRPTYTVSGNLKYLTFDGSNDRLDAASGAFTMTAPWSRICLIRQLSWTNGDRLMGSYNSYGGLSQGETTPRLLLWSGGGTLENPDAALSAWVITKEIHQHPTMTLQVNNNTAATSNPGTVNSADSVIIGADGAASKNGHYDNGGCVQRSGTFTTEQENTIKAAYAYRASISL